MNPRDLDQSYLPKLSQKCLYSFIHTHLPLKMLAKLIKKVKGHGSDFSDDLGQIYKLIPYQGKVLSLALDAYLKLWDHDLNLLFTLPVIQYYMIALAARGDEIFIGNGNGQVKVLDGIFKEKRVYKICGDVISDIKVQGETLAAISYDGTVSTINLEGGEQRSLKVQGQLFSICKCDGHYYLGGTKSYKIKEDLSHYQEIQRAQHYIVVNGQLYASSHRRGVYKMSQNISTYTPCDVISPMGPKILGTFDHGITLLTSSPQGLSWKSQLIPDFKPGYPQRAIVTLSPQQFITAGDNGVLYKFRLDQF